MSEVKLTHDTKVVAAFIASKMGRGTRAEKVAASEAFKGLAFMLGTTTDALSAAIGGGK